jgi:hypothetical protein
MTTDKMTNEEFVKMIMETTASATVAYLERKERQQLKAKRDWRLRNTKLLLRHYREFVEHSEEIKVSFLEEADALEDLYTDELTVEAIKRSKQRTLAMVRFIENVLQVYRIKCEKGTEEDLRRFKVIHAMYVAEEKLTVDQIAALHFISSRMVYYDIDNACETLSVLIFGIDAIHLK